MFDHTLKSDVTARRLEVITETGRRRWFSKDDKARIVEETLVVIRTATSTSYCLGPTALSSSKPWPDNDAYA
ncbi:FIG00440436 hypothetical protein CDS [Bradyrhizobium sp.]|nr:FIG00440436 hypothetical protein CDS [Bradyrhizobium sp.]